MTMKESNMSQNKNISEVNTEVVSIKLAEIPEPIQRGKGGRLGNEVYTMYGANNLYPNYLLRLYNNSSIHKSIIDSKVNYILGEGIVSAKTQQPTDFDVNAKDDIEDLFRKTLKDFVIFNYFAVEVVYNRDGSIAELNHLEASNIRTNKDHSKVWYSKDWSHPRTEIIDFDVWQRELGGDLESKVFFYSGYTPNVHSTYPTPEYSGSIKSIEIDIAIKTFHLNNISNSFSGNTIISFFRGEPTPKIKEEIVDSITGSYSGENGDKVIFQFLEKDEKEPTITSLNPTEWNEAYLSLRKDTIEDIIISHSVTSPMLCGIKTEGQLGGSTELETAYQIFNRLWVTVKRREFLNAINDILEEKYGTVSIANKDTLFPETISDTLKEKVYTIDEIRALDGLPALPNGEGNRLVSAPIVVKEESVVKAENMGFSKDLSEGINPYKELSEEEEDIFNSIGFSKKEAVFLESYKFSKEVDEILSTGFSKEDLTRYLIKNRLTGKSFKNIREDLLEASGVAYSLKDIRAEYGRLVALRVIPNTKLIPDKELQNIRNGYEGTLDNPNKALEGSLRKVEIRYSYEGVEDDKNRAFCHRMVRAGKLYSREDIQKISALFGYDVFNYKGGYNCRHNWQIHSVIRRDK